MPQRPPDWAPPVGWTPFGAQPPPRQHLVPPAPKNVLRQPATATTTATTTTAPAQKPQKVGVVAGGRTAEAQAKPSGKRSWDNVGIEELDVPVNPSSRFSILNLLNHYVDLS